MESSLLGFTTNGISFPIVNFPYLSSTVSSEPAYGVNVSQLIPLRKHTYWNISQKKKPESFQIKSLISFIFLLKT